MLRTLTDYQPFLSAILRTVTTGHQIFEKDSLNDCLKNNRLVVVFNHSTPISWIPAICLLTEKVCAAGGGDRLPRGIIDKFFFLVPGLNKIAEYLTQSDHPPSFQETLDGFLSQDQCDLVVFPEGALTFFGDPREIHPFRSPRFIEIAIRAQAPILLSVHRGTEDWNSMVAIPKEITPYVNMVSGFFGKHMSEEQFINIPMNLKQISNFLMTTKLYTPELTLAELSDDDRERRIQLDHEAGKIREVMQSLFDDLGAMMAQSTQSTPAGSDRDNAGGSRKEPEKRKRSARIQRETSDSSKKKRTPRKKR